MAGVIVGGITGAASAGINIASGGTQIIGQAHGSVLHRLSTNMNDNSGVSMLDSCVLND
jgi:hypothetical protein